MLFYSHLWDLLLKALSLLTIVALLMALHVQEWLERLGASSDTATLIIVIGLTLIWIPLYREGLTTLSAWLYATASLGASISFDDARQLARLFQLDVSLKWVPLKEVRKLPKAQRRDALLAALHGLAPHRKAMLF